MNKDEVNSEIIEGFTPEQVINSFASVSMTTKSERIARELRKNLQIPIEELIEIFKMGIVPYLFESIDEYTEFFKMLQNFFEADTKSSVDILEKLMEKYPTQFDKFLLFIVAEKRKDDFRNCIDYLKGKDVFVESYFITPIGYKYIFLCATAEIDIGKRKKSENPELSITLNERENEFVKNFKFYEFFLTVYDAIYAAKDERYLSAIVYNIKSYEEFKTNASEEERSKACRQMFYMIIPYLDLNKLVLSMVHTYVERVSNNHDEIVDLEALKILLDWIKKASNTEIKWDKSEVSFILPSSVKFFNKKDGGTFADDNELKKETISDIPGLNITTEEVVKEAEDFITFIEIYNALNLHDLLFAMGQNIEGNSEFKDVFKKYSLRSERRLKIFCDVMNQRVETIYPNLKGESFRLQLRRYMISIIRVLYKEKLIDRDGIRSLDEVVAVSMIIAGDIRIDNEKLESAKFSQEALAHLCLYQPERISYCLENNLVSQEVLLKAGFELKNEFLTNSSLRDTGVVEKDFMLRVIEEVFKSSYMSIEDLSILVCEKKIDFEELAEMQLDKDVLRSQLSAEVLANLYIDIETKKIEYEGAVRIKIEQDESQGIKADDVKLGEKECQLRDELQVLRNRKRVYLACLENVQMTDEERNTFLKALLDGVFGKSDYLIACRSIGEMYKDRIIDVDFIVKQEVDIIVELIKLSVITPQDMKKYKDFIVSDEEKSLLRELCDSDGKSYETELALETFERLKPLIQSIINDKKLDFVKKYMIIYNLCYNEDVELEDDFWASCRNVILAENVEDFFKLLKEIYKDRGRKKVKSEGSKKDVKSDVDNDGKNDSKKKHMYPEMALIDFMMLLDPEVTITGYEDGNVIIESKKLNRVVCENMWVKRWGKIERTYGVATFAVDFDKFKANESKVIVPSKKGYRVNTIELYKCLPKIGTEERTTRKGKVIHYKDLDNTGKRKIYFDYLLYELGIDLENIRNGKDSRYTLEDADKIEEFLMEMRMLRWER